MTYAFLDKNDRQNQAKHKKMDFRLKRGVLAVGAENSGNPDSSKINPSCKWYKRMVKRGQ